MITAGVASDAGVSVLNSFTVYPYWVLILSVSPSTGLKALLPHCSSVAFATLSESSLILILKEFSSAP